MHEPVQSTPQEPSMRQGLSFKFASLFDRAAQRETSAEPAVSAPVELDLEALENVAGGLTVDGPHGGWASATVVDGPHGGW